jgi:hypothetical protein
MAVSGLLCAAVNVLIVLLMFLASPQWQLKMERENSVL